MNNTRKKPPVLKDSVREEKPKNNITVDQLKMAMADVSFRTLEEFARLKNLESQNDKVKSIKIKKGKDITINIH